MRPRSKSPGWSFAEQNLCYLRELLDEVLADSNGPHLSKLVGGGADVEGAALATAICDALLKYSGYRDLPYAASSPFDDPFVGAALLEGTGRVLGAHRKEHPDEPHAEAVALLEALSEVPGPPARSLYSRIVQRFELKPWLAGSKETDEFLGLFAQAGRLVIEHLRSAGGSGELLLVSTLEPCRDFESQPSCARLIASFGVKTVVYACDDTHSKGQGRSVLERHGVRVVPNASVEGNLALNRLFYATVHFVGLLHEAEAREHNRFRTLYVTVQLDRLRPIPTIGSGRLSIAFSVTPHPAIYAYRPEPHGPIPAFREFDANARDQQRVLFLTHLDEGFIAWYLERQVEFTGQIPGMIISSKGDEYALKIREVLAPSGIALYVNVFRRAHERVLGLLHMRMACEEVDGHRKLYAVLRTRSKHYQLYGTAQTLAKAVRKRRDVKRVHLFTHTLGVSALLDLIRLLREAGCFGATGNLQRTRFELIVVLAYADLEGASANKIIKQLEKNQLSNRMSVTEQRPPTEEGESADVLRQQLLVGDVDPLTLRILLQQEFLEAATWRERQAAGLLLDSAVRREPLLFSTLILSRLPEFFRESEWRQDCTILNAIAYHGRPDDKCVGPLKARLNSLAKALAGATQLGGVVLIDVIWRLCAAVCAVCENGTELKQVIVGSGLREFIARSGFLMKELFFYCGRFGQSKVEALQLAVELFAANGGCLSKQQRLHVLIRAVRLTTIWNTKELDGIRRRLGELRQADPEADRVGREEEARCQMVTRSGLQGVFTVESGREAALATYLFVRTASQVPDGRGLLAALEAQLQHLHGVKRSDERLLAWRGDKTALARIAFSELPVEKWHSYLMGMASDEDDTIRWAAVVLAMEPSYRLALLRGSVAQEDCRTVRRLVSEVLETAIGGSDNYWLRREFLVAFRAEHFERQLLPLNARLSLLDLPATREACLRPQGRNVHPEVAAEMARTTARLGRVVLVLPPVDPSDSPRPRGISSSTPPLGLGSLAAYLSQHGHDVEIVDCYRFPELMEALPNTAKEASLLGFSVVASTFETTLGIIARLHNHLRNNMPPVVVGGHAPTLQVNDFLEHPTFLWDYLVLGDGEHPTLMLLEALKAGKEAAIPGVIARKSGTTTMASAPFTGETWDSLPWVDRRAFVGPDKLNFEPCRTRDTSQREAHVVMSRGCGWRCTFCTEAVLRGAAGEVRRSAAGVLAELRWLLAKADVTRFQFVDDNLLPQIAAPGWRGPRKEWGMEFLDGLEGLRADYPEMRWRGIMRLEDFRDYADGSDDFVSRLQRSGCFLLAFGVEHGNEGIRRQLKGGSVSNAEIKGIVARLRAREILTKGYFVIGGPHESRASVDETVRCAVESGFSLAYFALYKSFRRLVDQGAGGKLKVLKRQNAFMRFKMLDEDLASRVASRLTEAEARLLFGEGYGPDRLAEAAEVMTELVRRGFDFTNLFKYNDFHEDLGRNNQLVNAWGVDDADPESELCKGVRRAYFEFYARESFLSEFLELVGRGY